MKKISVLGAGTMGLGIAQIVAFSGSEITLYDTSLDALEYAKKKISNNLKRLVDKQIVNKKKQKELFNSIFFTTNIDNVKGSNLIIEAVIESLEVKQQLFKQLESLVNESAILATNTSSLSITSIASACRQPDRVIGIHFFNPAPLMPLVELIPAIQTNKIVLRKVSKLIQLLGKKVVIAKDTPGFIVNRIARPFYGEALRLYEEGVASFATIDWAMKKLGGFKMGPFELMDFIGNDVNYAVTETIFKAFFYDQRYKPSFTQKRLLEAGFYGKKSSKGYYDYKDSSLNIKPIEDERLGQKIFWRILVMLINEAADALFWNIATKDDIDLAMKTGVNYPKGLLKWADEIGIDKVFNKLENLQREYGEDRYRPSPILKKLIKENKSFY